MVLPGVGWFWVQKMVDGSRWAELKPNERPWLLESMFFGERLQEIMDSIELYVSKGTPITNYSSDIKYENRC
jgi:hypothetical protein